MTTDVATLYCVPYAGGTGQAYARLNHRAQGTLRLAGLDLPGRGTQRGVPPARTSAEAVAALAGQVREELRAKPPAARYGLFGHSFGALLAHLLATELRTDHDAPPAVLVVSNCPPPHLIGHLDGSADDLLEIAARALRDTVRPRGGPGPGRIRDAGIESGRRDLALLRHGPMWEPPLLDIPVAGLCATDDPLQPGRTMAAWDRWTRSRFVLRAVPGGHFCFRDHPGPYLDALRGQLMTTTGAKADDAHDDRCRHRAAPAARGHRH
ncbi:thioesterase II family protein [Streptomyces sp. 4F14]|uniref:thioesterase II family protein n=1 Tax=Streptomyces sp. 4F14 TaxID=3394380 RepID=UPI003A8351EF